jgi:WD40 repeat protein
MGTAALSWSPNGRWLARAVSINPFGQQPSIELRTWDTDSGKLLPGPGTREGTLAWWGWSSDGQRLAVLDNRGQAMVWDAADPSKATVLGASRFRPDQIVATAWSPDGKVLATGSQEGVIKLRTASAGSSVITLRGHTARIRCLVWTRASQRLASADADGLVKVWDPASAKELMQLRFEARLFHQQPPGVYDTDSQVPVNLSWSPEGDHLAVGGDDGVIHSYETVSQRETPILHGHEAPVSVAWSPDGRRLASTPIEGGRWARPGTGVVRVWDMETGQELISLPGCGPQIAWSADGWRLEAGAAVWDATPLSP